MGFVASLFICDYNLVMNFNAKLVLLEDGDGFFGPGVRDLFLFIDSEKSVKAASEKMQISYSKAWRMIRNVEKAIGTTAVARFHGGPEGGSACLTEAGRDILEKYIQFEKLSKAAMEPIFEEQFGIK